jgi:hypothetical protein
MVLEDTIGHGYQGGFGDMVGMGEESLSWRMAGDAIDAYQDVRSGFHGKRLKLLLRFPEAVTTVTALLDGAVEPGGDRINDGIFERL